MKIAIIGDDSLPHSTLVHAKMLHELAVNLKVKGHEPIFIAPGDPTQKNRLNISTIDGVVYWKFKSGLLRGHGKINRAINETLLSYRAWRAIKPKLNLFGFDLIIYYSPTIFFGGLVNKLKNYCNAKSYLILRDIFPQWAVDGGLIRKGSLIEKYFKHFEYINYSAADKIGLMSPKNRLAFERNTHKCFDTEVLFNWADLNESNLSSFELRNKLGLEDKVIYFYGGNIGHAQDMLNLLRLADALKSLEKIHFVLLGQGDEVELVKNKIVEWKLDNTTLLPSVSQNEYKAILQEVDVGLFSLAASHKSHNFPGKLLGYMHAALPILGSVNKGNDLIDIITSNNAGFIFENGNDIEFHAAAAELFKSKSLRNESGIKGHHLLREYFSVESATETILKNVG